MNEIVT